MPIQSHVDQVETHFEAHHQDWYRAYQDDSPSGLLFRTRLELALRLVSTYVTPPGVALDLGCGCGPGALALARMGYEATGVDISESMIERAAVDAAREGLSDRCRFICADFAQVELPSARHRVVLALGFIEYFDDPASVLGRIRKWLADDGVLVLQTPNRLRLAYLLQGRVGRYVERWPGGLTFRQRSPREVERLARDCGFDVVDYRGHNLGPLRVGRRFIPGYRASLALQRGLDRVACRPWGRALGRLGSSFLMVLRKRGDAT